MITATPFVIEGKLDSAAAPSLLADIRARTTGPLQIDATACGGIGALCGQVLLAARIAAQGEGREFAINATDVMKHDLELLGLGETLLSVELHTCP